MNNQQMQITNPLKSIAITVISTSRDVLDDKDMAWLYLIVTPDVTHSPLFNTAIDRFGWEQHRERLITLNHNFQKLAGDF